MPVETSELPEFDELERMVVWRRERLEAAGFPYDLSLTLGLATYVDLHEACDLVRRCPPYLAAKILL